MDNIFFAGLDIVFFLNINNMESVKNNLKCLEGETYEKIIDGVIFDNGFSNR